MKSCIKSLLKDNKDGLSSKDLRKKAVKEYLSQNSETEMQPKRKQVAKSQYDEVLKKLTEKGKIVCENDIVQLSDAKEDSEKKKAKKDKKDKKQRQDENVSDANDDVVTNDNDSIKFTGKKRTIEKIVPVEEEVSAPSAGKTTDTAEATESDQTKKSVSKEKKKRQKTEKIGFNVEAPPKGDINPLTGKKLKKRSKEAYERRKARYLRVKKLDSRNKRAQAEFEANKKWMNSATTSSATVTADAATPQTYTSF